MRIRINVYVAGKTDALLTRAIPECFRDEFLMIKRYTNLRLLYFPISGCRIYAIKLFLVSKE